MAAGSCGGVTLSGCQMPTQHFPLPVNGGEAMMKGL